MLSHAHPPMLLQHVYSARCYKSALLDATRLLCCYASRLLCCYASRLLCCNASRLLCSMLHALLRCYAYTRTHVCSARCYTSALLDASALNVLLPRTVGLPCRTASVIRFLPQVSYHHACDDLLSAWSRPHPPYTARLCHAIRPLMLR
jgi:hypothetical protein